MGVGNTARSLLIVELVKILKKKKKTNRKYIFINTDIDIGM